MMNVRPVLPSYVRVSAFDTSTSKTATILQENNEKVYAHITSLEKQLHNAQDRYSNADHCAPQSLSPTAVLLPVSLFAQ
jgi:hypothetical protein